MNIEEGGCRAFVCEHEIPLVALLLSVPRMRRSKLNLPSRTLELLGSGFLPICSVSFFAISRRCDEVILCV